MRIIWFSWKDINHPKAGGAERISHLILTRLVDNNHQVTLFTADYSCSIKETKSVNYEIIRLGNRYTCYFLCTRAFFKDYLNKADLVIEEVNTIPFFATLFAKSPKFLLFHQLCRKVWFYEVPVFVGVFGFIFERLSLVMLRKIPALTMSKSTRLHLLEMGFMNLPKPLIESVELSPLKKMDYKFRGGIILSFGSFRSMKRTLHQLRAFELARDQKEFLTLIIAGSGSKKEVQKINKYVEKSRHKSAISLIGYVDEREKPFIMESADILLQTSVVEGWGLTVTEAGRRGTPTIAYNVNGLKDSIIDQKTGLLTKKNTPAHLAAAILEFFGSNFDRRTMSKNAFEFSLKFTPDATYRSFIETLSQYDQKL